MRLLTIGYGSLLTALGVGGYVASGRASRTALIPALFGVPVIALGVVSFTPFMRKPAVRAAIGIATLGFSGGARGFGKLPALFQGKAERPMAVASQTALALLSAGYVVVARRSLAKT